VLERFRDILPKKWQRVFQKRFVEGLEQQEAADALDMSRTTLAYQEYRIRRLLQRFVLRGIG
jgi:RNA polymerase sigma-70 factor (ECF subfamily)